jgi:hypothetical protein
MAGNPFELCDGQANRTSNPDDRNLAPGDELIEGRPRDAEQTGRLSYGEEELRIRAGS